MTYEELETLVNSIREKLGEESSALISDDTLNILSSYKGLLDKIGELENDNKKLREEKENLLKTNGQLFQKIGFDKPEDEEAEDEEVEEKSVDEIIDELIDEKGEIKDGE